MDILFELDSETYRKQVVFENGKKLIYVVVLRQICGLLVSALLFYSKSCGDLENIGFRFNPYDPCVTNRINFGNQNSVIFHVDDIMSNHVNPKVNDNFKECMNLNYWKHGEVKSNEEKVHKYLEINFDSKEKYKVKVKVGDYFERVINELPIKIIKSDTSLTPDGNNRFEKGNRKIMVKKET